MGINYSNIISAAELMKRIASSHEFALLCYYADAEEKDWFMYKGELK